MPAKSENNLCWECYMKEDGDITPAKNNPFTMSHIQDQQSRHYKVLKTAELMSLLCQFGDIINMKTGKHSILLFSNM